MPTRRKLEELLFQGPRVVGFRYHSYCRIAQKATKSTTHSAVLVFEERQSEIRRSGRNEKTLVFTLVRYVVVAQECTGGHAFCIVCRHGVGIW